MLPPRPFHRSKLRLFAGTIYYTLKKQLYWHFSKTKFANKIPPKLLPAEIFSHKTLLRRKLQNVDMWMQENKITNLRLAIKHLDGLIIAPGETFSYWRQIGLPTKRKGYLPGMLLRSGKVVAGVGGGLCQLSNLIYWLTLHTPLQVTERWRHSYDVFPDIKRNQPFGSGATCSYPNIDLQIKNPTTQKFQLHLELTPTHLRGQWLAEKEISYSYHIFEKDHEIRSAWWGGYTRHNKIYRTILDKQTAQPLAEELLTTNDAIMMYEPLITTSDQISHLQNP